MDQKLKKKLIIDFFNARQLPIDTRYLNSDDMVFNHVHVDYLWENDKQAWKDLATYLELNKEV